MKTRMLFLQILTSLILISPVSVYATPVLTLDEWIYGGDLFVYQDGHVTATYLGGSASYYQSLYIEGDDSSQQALLKKGRDDIGTVVDLGWFATGTQLSFRMHVDSTGIDFYSGISERNVDNIIHAAAITTKGADGSINTLVGFEDLYGGGDLDYNDFMFQLTNVFDPPPANTPLPATYALLILGLASLRMRPHRRTTS